MKRWLLLFAVLLFGAMLCLSCSDSGGGDDGDRNNNPLDGNGDEGGGETTGYVVSGRVLDGQSHPIEGVEVGLMNESTQLMTATDSDGNFSFSGIENGAYALTPIKVGYVFEPEYRVVTVAGANVGNQLFGGLDTGGGNGGDIPGTITVSVGTGLTPQISWDGGNVNAVIVMDTSAWGSDYEWKITSPTGQTNTIASPITYGQSPSGAVEEVNKPLEAGHEYRVTVSRLTSDGNIVGYGYFDTNDVTPEPGDGYTVSGSVVDGDRYGIAGAIVILASGAGVGSVETTTTDSSGDYSFTGVEDGEYTITVTHPSYQFREPMMMVTVSGENEIVSNFVAR